MKYFGSFSNISEWLDGIKKIKLAIISKYTLNKNLYNKLYPYMEDVRNETYAKKYGMYSSLEKVLKDDKIELNFTTNQIIYLDMDISKLSNSRQIPLMSFMNLVVYDVGLEIIYSQFHTGDDMSYATCGVCAFKYSKDNYKLDFVEKIGSCSIDDCKMQALLFLKKMFSFLTKYNIEYNDLFEQNRKYLYFNEGEYAINWYENKQINIKFNENSKINEKLYKIFYPHMEDESKKYNDQGIALPMKILSKQLSNNSEIRKKIFIDFSNGIISYTTNIMQSNFFNNFSNEIYNCVIYYVNYGIIYSKIQVGLSEKNEFCCVCAYEIDCESLNIKLMDNIGNTFTLENELLLYCFLDVLWQILKQHNLSFFDIVE